MRNMSFALTTPQVLAQTKDVTRRLGWLHLKAGDVFQPVRKCMGLQPGETVQKLAGPVLTLSTRREPLRRMTDDVEWGKFECRREGFPAMPPAEFVAMFCRTHKGCTPDTEVTRIEFNHDLLEGWLPMPAAPRNGTQVELLVRHGIWHYASPEKRQHWQAVVRGRWSEIRRARWVWQGLPGSPIAWRPVGFSYGIEP